MFCTVHHSVVPLLLLLYFLRLDMRKHPAVFFPFSKILSVILLVFIQSTIIEWTFSTSRAFWKIPGVQSHDYIYCFWESYVYRLKNHSRYAGRISSYCIWCFFLCEEASAQERGEWSVALCGEPGLVEMGGGQLDFLFQHRQVLRCSEHSYSHWLHPTPLFKDEGIVSGNGTATPESMS